MLCFPRHAFALATLSVLVFASPADVSAAGPRSPEPVVLTGAELPRLAGVAPERLVAFRWRRHRERWDQVPVQVDERKPADFGQAPNRFDGPLGQVEGMVYGTEPVGLSAVQYADPATWVGADTDAALDADDEVAAMWGDAGPRAPRRAHKPRGVRGKGATRLKLKDPLGGPKRFLYLYSSKGRRDPAAGEDYVSYDFVLASGEYRSTYDRRNGPNPESSRIASDVYELGFSDRWFFDAAAVTGEGGSGVDFLDGYKFGFGPGVCGRSEATFSAGEGAFVANLDGPIRAIRSYVGANSGPYTQRTHFFYERRHEVVTDLRVHAVPAPMTYHDMAPAAIGMSYLSSALGSAVTVDGVQDAVPGDPAAWHLWTGAPGSLFAAERIGGSVREELLDGASTFYLDDSTPSYEQCWGDDQALAQAGLRASTPVPNTDPSIGAAETVEATMTQVFAGPGVDAEAARGWSEAIDAPLAISSAKAQLDKG